MHTYTLYRDILNHMSLTPPINDNWLRDTYPNVTPAFRGQRFIIWSNGAVTSSPEQSSQIAGVFEDDPEIPRLAPAAEQLIRDLQNAGVDGLRFLPFTDVVEIVEHRAVASHRYHMGRTTWELYRMRMHDGSERTVHIVADGNADGVLGTLYTTYAEAQREWRKLTAPVTVPPAMDYDETRMVIDALERGWEPVEIERGWRRADHAETFICDGCGGEFPRSWAMAASLGTACPDCYDDLS